NTRDPQQARRCYDALLEDGRAGSGRTWRLTVQRRSRDGTANASDWIAKDSQKRVGRGANRP
ncbi:hypothetical protein K3Z98_18750, partial [Pseudomonas aeruginosa]|nr:hypothetical protein [Pseudomonas aeruginosa]